MQDAHLLPLMTFIPFVSIERVFPSPASIVSESHFEDHGCMKMQKNSDDMRSVSQDPTCCRHLHWQMPVYILMLRNTFKVPLQVRIRKNTLGHMLLPGCAPLASTSLCRLGHKGFGAGYWRGRHRCRHCRCWPWEGPFFSLKESSHVRFVHTRP